MKWLTLLAILFLTGCGGGSQSISKPTPTLSPTVTSVTVGPQNVTITVGGTQQFQTIVQGTGTFSTAVNWSVTGLGSVNASGLYTATGTPGTTFVQATSQEDSSVNGQAQVTITAASVSLPGWYGNLIPSDGSMPLPMDFDLEQTGTALKSGPVAVIAETTAQIGRYCSNFELQSPETSNSVLSSSPNNVLSSMTGSINGQSVTLSYTPYFFGLQRVISMQGTMSTDASGYSVIQGTYSTGLSACFPSGSLSGTFTFNQYKAFSGNYLGNAYDPNVPPGTPAISVPITINPGSLLYAAIPTPFGCPASPAYNMRVETDGRFFHLSTAYVGAELGSTNLVVWGVIAGPDASGNQLNAYIDSGGVGLSSCFDPLTLSMTMTQQ